MNKLSKFSLINVAFSFIVVVAIGGIMTPLHKASALTYTAGLKNDVITTADLDSQRVNASGTQLYPINQTIKVQNISIEYSPAPSPNPIPSISVNLNATNNSNLNSRIELAPTQSINPGDTKLFFNAAFNSPYGTPSDIAVQGTTYKINLVTGVDEELAPSGSGNGLVTINLVYSTNDVPDDDAYYAKFVVRNISGGGGSYMVDASQSATGVLPIPSVYTLGQVSVPYGGYSITSFDHVCYYPSQPVAYSPTGNFTIDASHQTHTFTVTCTPN